MTRPIADLDVPRTELERQIRALVARQREQQTPLADRSSQRLQTVLAPTHTTPEEGQS